MRFFPLAAGFIARGGKGALRNRLAKDPSVTLSSGCLSAGMKRLWCPSVYGIRRRTRNYAIYLALSVGFKIGAYDCEALCEN